MHVMIPRHFIRLAALAIPLFAASPAAAQVGIGFGGVPMMPSSPSR